MMVKVINADGCNDSDSVRQAYVAWRQLRRKIPAPPRYRTLYIHGEYQGVPGPSDAFLV